MFFAFPHNGWHEMVWENFEYEGFLESSMEFGEGRSFGFAEFVVFYVV